MDTLGPALQSLLDIANSALIECERPVGLITLAPGNNVVWDNCCDGGGELWVRVISAHPQPQAYGHAGGAAGQECGITDLKVQVGLGVVRCMHGVNEEGTPTAEQMTGDTLDMTRDADLLMQAVRGWPGTQFVVLKTLNIEQGSPLGPLGFCGGWEWTLSFRLLLRQGC
jgi:hypothetical protein